MGDQPTDPPADEGKLTMGALSKLIEDKITALVPNLLGASKPPASAPASAPATEVSTDIASQVNAAVKKLRDQEARQKTEADRDKAIQDLQDSLKSKEKVPVERSRLHKIMGWGEPD